MEGMTTGHVLSDAVLWIFFALVVFFRGVEELRKCGILPERINGGPATTKTVGRLNVESFRDLMRHEVRNELNPIVGKMSEYNGRQLDKLEDINLGIRELVTILRERR